ncbi:hypothetical protein [Legionella fallonii]|uniref:Uncharacterized protein n=1 Tax=Legionella fallonii LLAP-10 TaxID=1212491 RepID=A0A098G7E4_9GAMM|nr:hypothetical protein [Legionella fallonii]CEG57430.1 protein of unknown function [Legionella fallonii LLAP-10]
MSRIVYDKATLLSLRPATSKRIPSIPEEIRITQHTKVNTLFNNRSNSCKPETPHNNNKRDDLDPNGPAMTAISAY